MRLGSVLLPIMRDDAMARYRVQQQFMQGEIDAIRERLQHLVWESIKKIFALSFIII